MNPVLKTPRLAFLFAAVAAFAIPLAFPPDASACGRCGFFGNRCRFVSHVHHAAEIVAAPIVAAPAPISIINNYPAANGAAPYTLAVPGQTVYGLSAQIQTFQLNPDAVLRQAGELAKASQESANKALQGYGQTAALALSLQASQAAPQAAPQAISLPVAAAPPPVTQSLTVTFRDGKWVVDSGSAPQAATRDDSKDQAPPVPTPAAPAAGGQPTAGVAKRLVQKHCGQCHGPSLASPKGGVYLGGDEVDCDVSLSAVAAVMNGRMPPGGNLSVEDKMALVVELSAKR
jgi:mono/diheme cytochrome c family protein